MQNDLRNLEPYISFNLCLHVCMWLERHSTRIAPKFNYTYVRFVTKALCLHIGALSSLHREKRPKINFDLLVDLIHEMLDFIMIYRSANPAIIP